MAQPRVTSNAPSQKIIDSVQFAMPAGMDVWHTSSETALRLTYRFNNAQPDDLSYQFSGWTPFSAGQEKAVRSVLAEYASIINVVFEETKAADPDLNFGRVNLGSAGFGGYGYSYRTDGAGNVTSAELDGFAVFENTIDIAANRHLILHEIGHAMTLKHTGNYDAHDDGAPGPYLPSSQDNTKYSVMSYNPNPDTGRDSDHLMLYDIAALQARFGANLQYRTGNDAYRGPQGSIQAIWDAGGTDRIDGSSYGQALNIDLRDGHFSSLGLKDNLAIAYGVIIENATGGTGNDRIAGNQWANVISGGKGADRLNGKAGDDRIVGGPGNDNLSGGPGHDCFVFNAALSASANVDRISDFSPVHDVIRLDDTIFKSLENGRLAAAAFHTGAGAHDVNDRIIYNDDTGALIYDANGNRAGQATCFARVDTNLAITNLDFLVF